MKVDCPECAGKGKAEYERFVVVGPTGGYYEDFWNECENCNGSGSIEVDEEDLEEEVTDE